MAVRWFARSLATLVLACGASAVARPATACICVEPTATVVLGKGRVFILEGPRPEAIAGATVELQRLGDHVSVAATTTDADGEFELQTPPPGKYLLLVSHPAFMRTTVELRVKKGRPDGRKRLLVRLDIVGERDCGCGDACVAKADRAGKVEPQCLVEAAR